MLAYMEDCPGADTEELSEALGIKTDDTRRALLRLRFSSVLSASYPASSNATWYSLTRVVFSASVAAAMGERVGLNSVTGTIGRRRHQVESRKPWA